MAKKRKPAKRRKLSEAELSYQLFRAAFPTDKKNHYPAMWLRVVREARRMAKEGVL